MSITFYAPPDVNHYRNGQLKAETSKMHPNPPIITQEHEHLISPKYHIYFVRCPQHD